MAILTSRRIVQTSFLVDCSDFVLNIIVAILTGSAVLLVEAFQGAADLLTSGLLLIGLKRSRKRDDQRHGFGYGREIYFWAFVAALTMITVTTTLSIFDGLQHVVHPITIRNYPLAIGMLAISLITNGYAAYLSYNRLLQGQPDNHIVRAFINTPLIEVKVAFILDLMGTLAGLVGFCSLALYSLTGQHYFDGLGAIVMGIMIAGFAYLLIIEIKDLLVGRSAHPDVEAKIKEAVLANKSVKQVVGLRTMHLGSERLLINMDVKVPTALKATEIDRLIERLHDDIKKQVPSTRQVQVEVEVSS